jgi:phage I-like protein
MDRQYEFLNVLDFSDTNAIEMDPQGRPWVDAFKAGDWYDQRYGVTKIDNDYLDSIIKNFNDGVRGIEIAVDYDHGTDASKGNKAAGWIRALRRVGEKVQAAIEFTEEATKEIKDKQWRYFSPKFTDEYVHSEGGDKFGPTMLMGSLTNTPVFKGMAPINFSEAVLDADLTLIPEDVKTKEPEPVPPKQNEEGSAVDEAKLREMLGIGKDDSIEDAISKLATDAKSYSELRDAAEKNKTFAEQFPEQYKEQQELKERVIKAEAKEFAESLTKPVDLGEGKRSKVYPPVVAEKVQEVYREFAEGRGTLDGLSKVLDTVRSAGTVELGERSSSIDDPNKERTGEGDALREFSEKMGEVMRTEKLAPHDAMMKVAQDHPDLYQAYVNREVPQMGAASN